MNLNARRAVVTGASGLVGAELCRYLGASGWEVVGLVRNPRSRLLPKLPVRWSACDLPTSLPTRAFDGADVVIHCAYDTRGTDPVSAMRVNVEGTRVVYEASRASGADRFVFLSSFSSHPGARSIYGATKWHLEQELDPDRDLIVRAGLVLSRSGGLIGDMIDWIQRHFLVPVPAPGARIYSVLAGDLAAGVGQALRDDVVGVVPMAHPEPVSMRALVRDLCRHLGERCLRVPVPVHAALGVVRILERTGLVRTRYSERLLGLRDNPTVDIRDAVESMGYPFRSFSQSLEVLFPETPE